MTYTIQDIQEEFEVIAEDVEQYISSNKIKVGKNGSLSKKSYQALIDLFSNRTEHVIRTVGNNNQGHNMKNNLY